MFVLCFSITVAKSNYLVLCFSIIVAKSNLQVAKNRKKLFFIVEKTKKKKKKIEKPQLTIRVYGFSVNGLTWILRLVRIARCSLFECLYDHQLKLKIGYKL